MIVRLSFQYKSVPIDIELEEHEDFLRGQSFDPEPLKEVIDSVKKFIDTMVEH